MHPVYLSVQDLAYCYTLAMDHPFRLLHAFLGLSKCGRNIPPLNICRHALELGLFFPNETVGAIAVVLAGAAGQDSSEYSVEDAVARVWHERVKLGEEKAGDGLQILTTGERYSDLILSLTTSVRLCDSEGAY